MESKAENSMISPIKISLSPPSGKRQKTLSGKDGDKCDDASQQVVIYKNDKSDMGQDEQVQAISQLNQQNHQSHENVHWESELEPLLLNVLDVRNGVLFQQKRSTKKFKRKL
jgi:hypothetical protein